MKRRQKDEQDETPPQGGCLTPKPGTRMIVIPEHSADPMRLAAESVEALRREQQPRCVKTSKKKRKVRR
jgi:hypothetical protein